MPPLLIHSFEQYSGHAFYPRSAITAVDEVFHSYYCDCFHGLRPTTLVVQIQQLVACVCPDNNFELNDL